MSERVMWTVSSGEYSDYRVMCVCETKKIAEAVAAKYNLGSEYHKAFVEEIAVIDTDVQQVEVLSLTTNLWDDGRENHQGSSYRTEWPFDAIHGTPAVSWRWVRAPVHGGKGGRLDVFGVDQERVRKVFSEQRAALIADDAYRSRREMTGGKSQ